MADFTRKRSRIRSLAERVLAVLYVASLGLQDSARSAQERMAAPPQLVFPSAVDNLQADRGQIRAQLRDTCVLSTALGPGQTCSNVDQLRSYNRLHSIADDADFVRNEVGAAYPDFPLVGTSVSARDNHSQDRRP
jgi:hypothetical protein